MHGSDLANKYFKVWKPDYIKNYDASVPESQRRQRFRKSISYGYIENNGVLVLKVEDSKLVYRDDDVIPKFNKV